jgi:hypothetical protein
MGGHVEKFCGMRQMTTKEKMLAKYSEVCHRCGNKGHMSRECSASSFKCRICGGDHRINECPKNGASLQNMIKNRKHEVSEFAKQKVMVEMAEKERRMTNIKDGAGTGFGAAVGASGGGGNGGKLKGGDAAAGDNDDDDEFEGEGGEGDGGASGSGSGYGAGVGPGSAAVLCQPIPGPAAKKREKTGMPQFKFAPKEKPKPGFKLPAPDLGNDEPAAKKVKAGDGSGGGSGGDSDGSDGGLGGLLGDYGDSSGSDSDGDGDGKGGDVKSFF